MFNIFSRHRRNVEAKAVWCCQAFDNSIRMNEESGVHIVPSRNLLGERSFELSFNLFSVSVLEKSLKEQKELYPSIIDEDGRRPLVIFRPILYCPWCGANLKKVISRRTALFDELEQGLHRFLRHGNRGDEKGEC